MQFCTSYVCSGCVEWCDAGFTLVKVSRPRLIQLHSVFSLCPALSPSVQSRCLYLCVHGIPFTLVRFITPFCSLSFSLVEVLNISQRGSVASSLYYLKHCCLCSLVADSVLLYAMWNVSMPSRDTKPNTGNRLGLYYFQELWQSFTYRPGVEIAICMTS